MEEAGYDPARLPPGQYLTEKWPVLHAGSVASYDDLADWTLRVFGEVENELELSLGAVRRAAAHARTSRTSTASRAGRSSTRSFEGVHWRELAQLARPKPTARFVIAHAEPASRRTCRSRFLEDENALLATHADGEPLTPDHGYPLRLVIPGKYFWKSAKWLRGIELSSVDKPGFWERYGYNNDADPWSEERYEF